MFASSQTLWKCAKSTRIQSIATSRMRSAERLLHARECHQKNRKNQFCCLATQQRWRRKLRSACKDSQHCDVTQQDYFSRFFFKRVEMSRADESLGGRRLFKGPARLFVEIWGGNCVFVVAFRQREPVLTRQTRAWRFFVVEILEVNISAKQFDERSWVEKFQKKNFPLTMVSQNSFFLVTQSNTEVVIITQSINLYVPTFI